MRKLTTQRGSMAFWRTSGISVSGANSPGLLRASCRNVLSGLEWVQLFTSCTSRRWGSRQGSILSPALFSIKINNIVKAVLKGTFVDDFALCVSGKTLNRVERAMQLCVNSVQKWCLRTASSSLPLRRSVFISINSTFVCFFVFFLIYFLTPDPNILLGKTPIKVVKKAKFLGLIFDTKLTFKNHIQYLKTSCQKALDILRVVGHTD